MKKLILILLAAAALEFPAAVFADFDAWSGNVHLRGDQYDIKGRKFFAYIDSDTMYVGFIDADSAYTWELIINPTGVEDSCLVIKTTTAVKALFDSTGNGKLAGWLSVEDSIYTAEMRINPAGIEDSAFVIQTPTAVKILADSSGNLTLIGILTVGGETVLGDASTDTTDVYGLINLRANGRVFNTAPKVDLFDSANETGASLDTSVVNIEADGTPSITLFETDGDAWTLTINTSDQAVLKNASGGYLIDKDLLISVNLSGDIGTSGTIFDSAFVDNFVATTDITNNGETFLGDALTDTTEVFRVRFKGKVIFDSLATGVNYIDLTNADNASASTYWIYANSNNYWVTNGYLRAGNIQAVFGQWMSDDYAYGIGNGSSYSVATSASLLWETADANANELLLTMPEGGATDVPVLVVADSTSFNKDLGWFNGITEPRIAVVSDSATSYLFLGHNPATGQPRLGYGGTANAWNINGDVVVDSSLTVSRQFIGNALTRGNDSFAAGALVDTLVNALFTANMNVVGNWNYVLTSDSTCLSPSFYTGKEDTIIVSTQPIVTGEIGDSPARSYFYQIQF